MTTYTDMTRQIEEMLGSEGNTDLAVKMLDELYIRQEISFHPSRGYEFAEREAHDAEFVWNAALLCVLMKEVR